MEGRVFHVRAPQDLFKKKAQMVLNSLNMLRIQVSCRIPPTDSISSNAKPRH